MTLREKADYYLNEKKAGVLNTLKERDFKNCFEFEEWLIGSLLRDAEEREESLKKELSTSLALGKSLLDVNILKKKYSREEVERLLVYSIIGRLGLNFAAIYFSVGSKLVLGDASQKISQISLPESFPVKIASEIPQEESLPIYDLASLLKLQNEDELGEAKNAKIMFIIAGKSIVGAILGGPKVNKENIYSIADTEYLNFASDMLSVYLDMHKEKSKLKSTSQETKDSTILEVAKTKCNDSKTKEFSVAVIKITYKIKATSDIPYDKSILEIEKAVKREFSSSKTYIFAPLSFAIYLSSAKKKDIQNQINAIKSSLAARGVSPISHTLDILEYKENDYENTQDYISRLAFLLAGGQVKSLPPLEKKNKSPKKTAKNLPKRTTTKKTTKKHTAKKTTPATKKAAKKTSPKKTTKKFAPKETTKRNATKKATIKKAMKKTDAKALAKRSITEKASSEENKQTEVKPTPVKTSTKKLTKKTSQKKVSDNKKETKPKAEKVDSLKIDEGQTTKAEISTIQNQSDKKTVAKTTTKKPRNKTVKKTATKSDENETKTQEGQNASK